MLVTDFVRRALPERRFWRAMERSGYERIEENGHPLWQLARGGRTDCRIMDARVSPGGRSVWIKIGKDDA